MRQDTDNYNRPLAPTSSKTFDNMSTITIPFGQGAEIVGTNIDSFVNRFLGIPYALPPIGDNRWKKPRKLPSDYLREVGKYDATQFKDICLQPPSPLPHDPSQPATVQSTILTTETNVVLRGLSVCERLGPDSEAST